MQQQQQQQKQWVGTGRRQTSLAALARRYGIRYGTLWQWVRVGDIVLPRDEYKLARVRRADNGRYYIAAE